METLEKPQQHGGIYNYFSGATINNLVINGNMTKNGPENYNSNQEKKNTYSDTQIAQALSRIVGKGKAIDTKQKWAGACGCCAGSATTPHVPLTFANASRACHCLRTWKLVANTTTSDR